MHNVLYTLVIYPASLLIELSFVFFQRICSNLGIAVLGVSAVVTVCCLPLYDVAEKWQQKERDLEAKLRPGKARIEKAFRGDERYMILNTFYRQASYHPIMALRSSFGLLIQIPFFLAAYTYLSNLQGLNGSSFLFIRDMGRPDGTFCIAGFSVNVLPILMTAINCIAGAVYTRGLPLKEKIQIYAMALIFLVILYSSPAGLVLYWTMNNVFSLLKNLYYKINIKEKNKILLCLLALVLVLLAVYINVLGKGSDSVRIVLSFAFALPAIFCLYKVFSKEKNKKNYFDFVQKNLSIKNCHFLFFASAAFFVLFTGLYVPLSLVGASPQEFSYIDGYASPLYFCLNAFLQTAGIFFVWPALLYFLFSHNVKRGLAILFAILSFGAVLDFFLFHADYGLITNVLVFDNGIDHSAFETLLNLFALALLAALVVFVLRKNKIAFLPKIISLLFAVILVMSVVESVKINSSFSRLEKPIESSANESDSVEPIFNFSKTGKNVCVIMLDRAIGVLIPYILDDYPWLKEAFDGFVFYPNTVSFGNWTNVGSIPIFGGYQYTPLEINAQKNVSLKEKRNQALKLMPRIFSENGFNVFVSDMPYANSQEIPDMKIFSDIPNTRAFLTDGKYTDVWCRTHSLNMPSVSEVLKRNILFYSIIKVSPYAIRQLVYNNGNYNALVKNISLRKTIDGYAVLDYMPSLCSVSEEPSLNALVMANNITHEGATLQEPDYVPTDAVSSYGSGKYARDDGYHINAAALMRLSEWFKFLKESGCYDNTRIILVSDHGPQENYVIKSSLKINIDQYVPLLMEKDFSSRGPILFNDDFMSTADVPTMAFKGLVENPSNPYRGGQKIDSSAKKDPLYIAVSGGGALSGINGEEGFSLKPEDDFYVTENVYDEKNWIPATAEKR